LVYLGLVLLRFGTHTWRTERQSGARTVSLNISEVGWERIYPTLPAQAVPCPPGRSYNGL